MCIFGAELPAPLGHWAAAKQTGHLVNQASGMAARCRRAYVAQLLVLQRALPRPVSVDGSLFGMNAAFRAACVVLGVAVVLGDTRNGSYGEQRELLYVTASQVQIDTDRIASVLQTARFDMVKSMHIRYRDILQWQYDARIRDLQSRIAACRPCEVVRRYVLGQKLEKSRRHHRYRESAEDQQVAAFEDIGKGVMKCKAAARDAVDLLVKLEQTTATSDGIDWQALYKQMVGYHDIVKVNGALICQFLRSSGCLRVLPLIGYHGTPVYADLTDLVARIRKVGTRAVMRFHESKVQLHRVSIVAAKQVLQRLSDNNWKTMAALDAKKYQIPWWQVLSRRSLNEEFRRLVNDELAVKRDLEALTNSAVLVEKRLSVAHGAFKMAALAMEDAARILDLAQKRTPTSPIWADVLTDLLKQVEHVDDVLTRVSWKLGNT